MLIERENVQSVRVGLVKIFDLQKKGQLPRAAWFYDFIDDGMYATKNCYFLFRKLICRNIVLCNRSINKILVLSWFLSWFLSGPLEVEGQLEGEVVDGMVLLLSAVLDDGIKACKYEPGMLHYSLPTCDLTELLGNYCTNLVCKKKILMCFLHWRYL